MTSVLEAEFQEEEDSASVSSDTSKGSTSSLDTDDPENWGPYYWSEGVRDGNFDSDQGAASLKIAQDTEKPRRSKAMPTTIVKDNVKYYTFKTVRSMVRVFWSLSTLDLLAL